MNSTAEVQFGELPPERRGGRDSANGHIAEALRGKPNEWAKVASKASSNSAGTYAHHIRNGLLRPFRPAGSFEAVQRGQDVWARYVGEVSA